MSEQKVEIKKVWHCAKCNKHMEDWLSVGWDGPADGNGNPDPGSKKDNPLIDPWVTLCRQCYGRK